MDYVVVDKEKNSKDTEKSDKRKKTVAKKETITKKNVNKNKVGEEQRKIMEVSKEIGVEGMDVMPEGKEEKGEQEKLIVAESVVKPAPKKRGRKKKSEILPKEIEVPTKTSKESKSISMELEKKTTKERQTKKMGTKKMETKSSNLLSTKVVFQYNGSEVELQCLIEKAKQAFLEESGKDALIQSLDIYVKPEDNAAYYVVNGSAAGKVAMV